MHNQPIILDDLQTSLQDFLASKTPSLAAAVAADVAASSSPGQGFSLAPALDALRASWAAPPAAPAVTTTATPPTVAEEEDDEWQALQEPAAGSFAGLPQQFLQDMQAALEALGFDLTSPSIMQQLAGDPNLASQLLPLLGGDAAVAAERVRQWQQAIEQQLEQEMEASKNKKRPVWRCSACGRYGCNFAPYIERYEEV